MLFSLLSQQRKSSDDGQGCLLSPPTQKGLQRLSLGEQRHTRPKTRVELNMKTTIDHILLLNIEVVLEH